jgi:hypothetical protein
VIWLWILLGALGCYLLKAAGLFVPSGWFARPAVSRVNDALPIAVLTSLAVSGTFAAGPGHLQGLTVDHRAAGLAVAVIGIALRAPFIVIICAAAATAATVAALS